MDISQVAARAREITEQEMSLLESWIRHNSYSQEVDRVNELGEKISTSISALGLHLEKRQDETGVYHYLMSTEKWQQEPGILLVGHHDTVFPPGYFETWQVSGDEMHGPGVIDMKGGLFVAYAAIKALSENRALDRSLAMILVGDEEIGSYGSRSWLRELAPNTKGALVFEAGRADDMLIVARKGTGQMFISWTGNAAHAGNHHREGINAINVAANFILKAAALTDYDQGTTVNVGLIKGGTAINTVPDNVRVEVDFRFTSTDIGKVIEKNLAAIAQETAKAGGCQVKIEGGVSRPAMIATDENRALMARYAACAKEAGLGYSECPLIGGGSDANIIADAGVAAIDGLGPKGSGFHTLNERGSLSSLAAKADALSRFLLSS